MHSDKFVHSNFGIRLKSKHLDQKVREQALADLVQKFGLVIISDLSLDRGSLERLSITLGEVDGHPLDRFNGDSDNVVVLSNVRDINGTLIGADRSGMQWHTDGTFKAEPPRFTLLYCVETPPEGGSTEFCLSTDALECFDQDEKLVLSDSTVIHDYSFYWSHFQSSRPPLTESERKKYPQIRRPALRMNLVSQRNGIYFMKCVCPRIEGLPHQISCQWLDRLENYMSGSNIKFTHKWSPGDLLIWDNRSMLHRATNFDNKFRRVMYRTTVQ